MTLTILESVNSSKVGPQQKRSFAFLQKQAFLPLSLDVRFKLHHPAVFLLRLESNRWESEGIYEGDVLVVDRCLPLSINSLVVIVLDGELVLAKVQQKKAVRWQLVDNKGKVIEAISHYQEAEQLWGVVKALVREY